MGERGIDAEVAAHGHRRRGRPCRIEGADAIPEKSELWMIHAGPPSTA